MSNEPFNPYEGTDNTPPVPPTEPLANSVPESGGNAYQAPGAPYQEPAGQPTPPPSSAYPPPYQAPVEPQTPPPSAYPPPYQAQQPYPNNVSGANNANNPYPPKPVYTVAQPKPANGMAIASLVLGILSVLCCCLWFLGGGIIPGLVGLILAIICFSKGNKGGVAVAGLVLSIIGLVLSVVSIITLIANGTFAEFMYALEHGDLDDLYYYYYRNYSMIFLR